MQTVETRELILPAFLASALINGDLTGLEDRDEPLFYNVLELTKGWNPVDCGESYFDDIWSPLVGHFVGDVCAYTFLKYTDE